MDGSGGRGRGGGGRGVGLAGVRKNRSDGVAMVASLYPFFLSFYVCDSK